MTTTAPAQSPKLPDDFDRKRLARVYEPLPGRATDAAYAWPLDRVRDARDAQMRGDFRVSSPLAEATKCDPTLYGALLNRICPHRRLARTWSANNKRIEQEAAETFARDGEALSGPVVADVFERLVQQGLAIGQNIWTPRPDGSRVDVRLAPWPMNSVWHDRTTGTLKTMTTTGIETIVHGDGKWVVVKHHAAQPWQWGAIKACGVAWASRAFHIRDRSLNSDTHGEGKFVGTPPPDMDLNSEDGQAFRELVLNLRSRRSGGIKPNGSEIDLLEAMSQMWQIFREAIVSLDKDVARAYLGQDGSLVNEGGNYIKAAELAGVRYDLVEGDCTSTGDGFSTGTLRPWSIVNFGRDAKVKTGWALPDPDEQARRESYAKSVDAFNKAMKEFRANGFVIDQPLVNRTWDGLVAGFGVEAPTLGQEPPPAPAPAPAAAA